MQNTCFLGLVEKKSNMNMLCGMKYDKEKGCTEGPKNFETMYLRPWMTGA